MLKRYLFLICLGVMACLSMGSASAEIINGDFSSGLLNPWVAYPSANVSVINDSALGEVAVMSTGNHEIYDTVLFQDIAIPSGAYLFSFDFLFSSVDDGSSVGDLSFTDWFQVSYYDDDSSGTFDRIFMNCDVNGPYDFYDPSITIALIDLDNGMFRFQANIGNLQGRNGTLYFDLFDELDGKSTTVTIDNVQILERQASPIPEPGTLLMLAAGLGCLMGIRVRHKRNSAA